MTLSEFLIKHQDEVAAVLPESGDDNVMIFTRCGSILRMAPQLMGYDIKHVRHEVWE